MANILVIQIFVIQIYTNTMINMMMSDKLLSQYTGKTHSSSNTNANSVVE